jgi:hypothetical protein
MLVRATHHCSFAFTRLYHARPRFRIICWAGILASGGVSVVASSSESSRPSPLFCGSSVLFLCTFLLHNRFLLEGPASALAQQGPGPDYLLGCLKHPGLADGGGVQKEQPPSRLGDTRVAPNLKKMLS